MKFTIILLLSWFSTSGPLTSSIDSLEHIDLSDHSEIMKFDTNFIELGEVKKGDSRTFQFDFTNVGHEDLIIEFMSSCDCTTLDYPLDPIKPGERGTIGIIFDSSEKTESETVDVDIDLANKDENGIPIFIRVNYSFVLVK